MINSGMPGSKYLLYVEDEITRRYLGSLQPNRKLLEFRVVGGADRVRGCLEDDIRSNTPGTFGVIDRDFDRLAKSGWCSSGSGAQYYCLPAHEIENYLLDFDLIAQFECPGINPQKPADHWRFIARKVAESYLYSIAYNQVLADIRRDYLAHFPPHIKLSSGPAQDYSVSLTGTLIASEEDMIGMLQSNAWIASAISRASDVFEASSLKQRAAEAVAYYQSLLDDQKDAWVQGFPGKEMFRAITNSMSLSDEQWLDMTHSIADKQQIRSRIPLDISVLLSKFV